MRAWSRKSTEPRTQTHPFYSLYMGNVLCCCDLRLFDVCNLNTFSWTQTFWFIMYPRSISCSIIVLLFHHYWWTKERDALCGTETNTWCRCNKHFFVLFLFHLQSLKCQVFSYASFIPLLLLSIHHPAHSKHIPSIRVSSVDPVRPPTQGQLCSP